MPRLHLTCPENKKDITVDTDNEQEFTIVSWDDGKVYNGRYRCPLCNCIELTDLNPQQASVLKAYPRSRGIVVQEISGPAFDKPLADEDGKPLDPFSVDDLIEFHLRLEESSYPSKN